MRKRPSEKSLANLKPFKPGPDPRRTGANGWTKARERVAKALEENADDLSKVLVNLAKSGDVAALKLALGPLMPAEVKQLDVTHQGKVSLQWKEPKTPRPKPEAETDAGSDPA